MGFQDVFRHGIWFFVMFFRYVIQHSSRVEDSCTFKMIVIRCSVIESGMTRHIVMFKGFWYQFLSSFLPFSGLLAGLQEKHHML